MRCMFEECVSAEYFCEICPNMNGSVWRCKAVTMSDNFKHDLSELSPSQYIWLEKLQLEEFFLKCCPFIVVLYFCDYGRWCCCAESDNYLFSNSSQLWLHHIINQYFTSRKCWKSRHESDMFMKLHEKIRPASLGLINFKNSFEWNFEIEFWHEDMEITVELKFKWELEHCF